MRPCTSTPSNAFRTTRDCVFYRSRRATLDRSALAAIALNIENTRDFRQESSLARQDTGKAAVRP